jgi:hypothetical protein
LPWQRCWRPLKTADSGEDEVAAAEQEVVNRALLPPDHRLLLPQALQLRALRLRGPTLHKLRLPLFEAVIVTQVWVVLTRIQD